MQIKHILRISLGSTAILTWLAIHGMVVEAHRRGWAGIAMYMAIFACFAVSAVMQGRLAKAARKLQQ